MCPAGGHARVSELNESHKLEFNPSEEVCIR